jgi:phage baseplate assembly protein W
MAEDIIGTGWAFPPKVNATGGLSWSTGPRRIQDSIWIVLSTSLGERIMRPTFGGGIHDFVFQANSAVTRTSLASAVKEALTRWEPRIELDAVRVEEDAIDPAEVRISIDYRIRSTNELFNLVFPLYVAEGAG